MPSPATRVRRTKYLLKTFCIIAAYIVTAKLGLLLAIVQPNVTAIWAPAGIAIAMLFICGYSLWPAVFIAAFFVNATTPGTALWAAVGIAIGNTLEAVIAAYFARRSLQGLRLFERVSSVFSYALYAGMLAPAVSATIGTASLMLAGMLPWSAYATAWVTWWLGDAGGALVIAPFIIVWVTWYPLIWREWWRNKLLPTIAFGAIVLVFNDMILRDNLIFAYFLFPVFVWAAFMFGPRVITLGVLVLTEFLLWGTLHGAGPFVIQSGGDLNEALLLLDAAMTTFAVTMLGFAAAVEEKKSTHEVLQREKAMEEAALATVDDAFLVINKRAEVIMVNSVAETVLCAPRTAFLGKPLVDAIHMEKEDGTPVSPSERPMVKALRNGERAGNNPFMGFEYFVRPDGSRFLVSCVATPVVIGGEIVGAIEFFRDMTKEQEENKAKTDLIALTSHQLRTPLSVIGLTSELLQGQGTLFGSYEKEDVESYARDIQIATRQMTEIVNDLLNISRIESKTLVTKIETVDLGSIVRYFLESMAPKIKQKHLRVDVNIAPEAKRFATDQSVATIILQNLISNAVKYASERGIVGISIASEGGDAVIAVSDTGRGIPRDEQAKVFEKFFRATNAARSESEGTGLGLYITKSMVEQLGGTISFASEEGEGSTFIVRLPPGGVPHVVVPNAQVPQSR